MARRPVNIRHIRERLENPHKSFSRNRCPFLVLENEIHYLPGDSVHAHGLAKIPKSKVKHAGSIFIDPLMPFEVAGLTRVSWDNMDIPTAPDSVMNEVKEHVRQQVRDLAGEERAKKMVFRDLK
jgi:hypothetical protein